MASLAPAPGNSCTSHPERPAHSLCEGCKKPFCSDCLVLIRGRTYCSPCGEDRLVQPSGSLLGVEWMVGFVALIGVLGVFFLIFGVVLAFRQVASTVAAPVPVAPFPAVPGTVPAGAWTKGLIAEVALAVEAYKIDAKGLPKGDLGDLLQAMRNGLNPPYMVLDPKRFPDPTTGRAIVIVEAVQLQDEWGVELRFVCPGVKNPTSYDLYSTGPNGIDENGAGDDILHAFGGDEE